MGRHGEKLNNGDKYMMVNESNHSTVQLCKLRYKEIIFTFLLICSLKKILNK